MTAHPIALTPVAAPPADRRPLAVPLHEKEVLTYQEAHALGICAERTLRRLVAAGKVARAVIRNGARVKFIKAALLEELRETQA